MIVVAEVFILLNKFIAKVIICSLIISNFSYSFVLLFRGVDATFIIMIAFMLFLSLI